MFTIFGMLLALGGSLWAGTAAPQEAPFSKTTHVFKVAGQCEIKADVYLPRAGPPRPAVLWLHGGALIDGNRVAGVRPAQLQRVLDAGLAVVSIDYRLAPETKLPLILEDVRDAYRWLRKNGRRMFGIDPDRIAVLGQSAGGYLTLMCGTMLKPRPKALVSFYGYGDIAGEWYSRPDPFYLKQPAVPRQEAYDSVGTAPISEPAGAKNRWRFYLYCRQQGLWPKEVTGRDPDAEPKVFVPWCPVRNVTRRYPPALLLHGDADTDVPYQQSVRMAAEMKRHGVEHELITIPGGGHGFDRAMKDPKISEIFDRVVAFLRAHLR